MDIKITGKMDVFHLFFFTVCFFLPAKVIFSQEPPPPVTEGAVFLRETEEGSRLVQRLSWPGDENASYEVVIEQLEDGEFREIIRETARENYFDVSLGPGSYRYQVVFYNLLGQFEYATNRASFEIILALQPELNDFNPLFFYQNEDYKFELTIIGRNLVRGANVFLIPSGAEKDEAGFIKPQHYIPDNSGTRALLVFGRQDLRLGRYVVYVQNPGGLEARIGILDIVFAKPFDLNIQVDYTLLVPLHGYLFDDLFTRSVYPVSGRLKASFIPFKRTWGYLGLELSPWWGFLSTGKNSLKADTHLWGTHINFLYKKLLFGQYASLNARAGLGIVFLNGLRFTYAGNLADPLNSWGPSIDVGLSFQVYIHKPLYIGIGIDYIHLLFRDSPQPGFLSTGVEIGWRF